MKLVLLLCVLTMPALAQWEEAGNQSAGRINALLWQDGALFVGTTERPPP